MQEKPPPDPGPAPKKPGRALQPLPTALLAAAICLGLVFFGHRSAPDTKSPAVGGAAAGAPAAQAVPAVPPPVPAPALVPLGRSLEGMTTRYGKGMKPTWVEPILSGPLEGGTVRKFVTGSATDDLSAFNGAVYRRVMSFRLAEMLESVEGTHANFSGLVFIYALYPSAFDEQQESGKISPEVQALADGYGAKCGALAEPGSPPQEHRETHSGYVFSCSNKDTTRLIYGVCSEGLLAAEAAAGN